MTEHCCQVCVLSMMFCRSDCRLCAGMCGKWLRNQETPRTTCFDTPTGQHGIWKIFFTFDFNILPEQRLSLYFNKKRFSVLTHLPGNRSRLKNCCIALKRSSDVHIDTYYCKPELISWDKSAWQCFTCLFCRRLVRNVRSRRRFDSSSIIAHPVNFDNTQWHSGRDC